MSEKRQIVTTLRFEFAIWRYIKRACLDRRITFQSWIDEAVTEKLRNEPLDKGRE